MLWALLTVGIAAEAPEGSPFADVPFFHHSSLKPIKRVHAEFPSVPPAEAAQRHRCMVWVKIGADGAPAEVNIVDAYAGEGCSAPFQVAAKAAVSEWRWKPVKVDKVKSTVHTQIAEVFPPVQSAPLIDVSLEGSPPPEPVKQPKYDSKTGLPIVDESAPQPASMPTPEPQPRAEPEPAPPEPERADPEQEAAE